MKVTTISRTEAQDFAIKLRELARQLDAGQVTYCLAYSVDRMNRVEEIEFDKSTVSRALSA